MYLSKEHETPIQFRCDYCDMKFFTKKGIEIHMKDVKEEEGGKHKCNLCYFKSCTKRGLSFHRKSHPEINVKICDYCGKTFQSISNWNKHIKIVHNVM